MTLSNRVLSSIQTAGASVHAAEAEIKKTVQAYEEQVKLTMRENPFDANGKNLFESWKATALLAQGIARMEFEFQRLYRAAQEIVLDPSSAITLLTSENAMTVKKLSGRRSTKDLAPRSRRVRGVSAGKSANSSKSSAPGELRGNAARVLERLQKLLANQDDFVKINRAAIASEVGLPKGSIGASIDKLVQTGHLIEGAPGYFKLGAAKD